MNLFEKIGLLWKYRREARAAVARQIRLLEGDAITQTLGSLTDEELAGLAEWVEEVPAGGTVVEIGTLFGLTTIEMARHAQEGVRIVTVDNFSWNPFGLPPAQHEQFTRRVLEPWIDSGKVELVKADSDLFRKDFEVVPDLLFLDADHAYEAVRQELEWAARIGAKVISGHDYGRSEFGVTRAVDAVAPKGVLTAGSCWRIRR